MPDIDTTAPEPAKPDENKSEDTPEKNKSEDNSLLSAEVVALRLKKAKEEGIAEARKQLAEEAETSKLEANKEFEKLLSKERDKVSALTQELAHLRLSVKKSEIATKHGIPANLVGRLIGANEDEIEADAKLLKKSLAISDSSLPVGTPTGGKSTTSAKNDIRADYTNRYTI